MCEPLLQIVVIVGCTDLLQHVLGGDRLQHVLLGGLLHLAADQQFVQYEVGLLKVEDDVQLAHLRQGEMVRRGGTRQISIFRNVTHTFLETYTAKILVQQLHVAVDDLQRQQLVVVLLHRTAEVQAGISANWNSEGVSVTGIHRHETGMFSNRLVSFSNKTLSNRTLVIFENLFKAHNDGEYI